MIPAGLRRQAFTTSKSEVLNMSLTRRAGFRADGKQPFSTGSMVPMPPFSSMAGTTFACHQIHRLDGSAQQRDSRADTDAI